MCKEETNRERAVTSLCLSLFVNSIYCVLRGTASVRFFFLFVFVFFNFIYKPPQILSSSLFQVAKNAPAPG